jgi:hypothetical protein
VHWNWVRIDGYAYTESKASGRGQQGYESPCGAQRTVRRVRLGLRVFACLTYTFEDEYLTADWLHACASWTACQVHPSDGPWRSRADAGFPRRSPEWIAELFNTHCRPCEWYDPDGRTLIRRRGVCLKCGCHVSDIFDRLDNKLMFPNASCPLDPPKWGPSVDSDPNNEEPNP